MIRYLIADKGAFLGLKNWFPGCILFPSVRWFFTCQTAQQSKSWSDDSMSFANNT